MYMRNAASMGSPVRGRYMLWIFLPYVDFSPLKADVFRAYIYLLQRWCRAQVA